MPLPKVVITGLPGVGKSSVLRWILGRKAAVGHEGEERFAKEAEKGLAQVGDERDPRFFELVDAGPLGTAPGDGLDLVEGLSDADLILFVVDIRGEPSPAEVQAAVQLGYVKAPVILVMNKADTAELDGRAAAFSRLGRGRPIAVSTAGDRNREALLALIAERLPAGDAGPAHPPLKIALVGRPNAGKATFAASVARSGWGGFPSTGEPDPGADLHVELDGRPVTILGSGSGSDGPSAFDGLDLAMVERAEASIRRADVVLFLLDLKQGITRLDRQLGDAIARRYKPCIFVINKMDQLVPDGGGAAGAGLLVKHAHAVQHAFRPMSYMPLAFVSAASGRNLREVLDEAVVLGQQARARVEARTLNWVLREAVARRPPKAVGARLPRVEGALQVATSPPTIVTFVNSTTLFDAADRRHLLSVFREKLPFHDVPIKLYLRSRTHAVTPAPAPPPDPDPDPEPEPEPEPGWQGAIEEAAEAAGDLRRLDRQVNELLCEFSD